MRFDRLTLTAALMLGGLTLPAAAATTFADSPSGARAQPAYERLALGNANQPSRRVPQHGQRAGGPRGRR